MYNSDIERMKNHRQEIVNNELLEIFILIEENNMSAKVEALTRYKNLYGIKDPTLANNNMKIAYANFKK
jgi:hypothetical protein